MTRAERWRKKHTDAAARQPGISFEGLRMYASFDGVNIEGRQATITIKDARIPALTKFLHEYFVRRDK